jgi:hypothetical protein
MQKLLKLVNEKPRLQEFMSINIYINIQNAFGFIMIECKIKTIKFTLKTLALKLHKLTVSAKCMVGLYVT